MTVADKVVVPEKSNKEEWQRTWSTRMAVLGPGIVYALTIMGTGDIVSNAAAGAGYGYAMIWALGLTLIFRYVWVNTSAKYVLVTGETLIKGYARLGNWTLWVILIAGLVFRHFYNMYLIVMMGTSLDLLIHLPTPWSSAIWAVTFTIIGYFMMVYGGYQLVDRLFKIFIAAKGASLVVAAALSNPDPVGIARGAFIPSIPGQEGVYSALLVLMALVGTEAGSMTNLTYPYFMYEKGWRDRSHIKRQRFDLVFGVVSIFVMGALLQIAAAGTIKPLGIKLEGPEHLVQIFFQTQGMLGLVIFTLGIWSASFGTYVGASMGYAMIITDLCRSYIPRFKKPLDESNKKKAVTYDPIYRACIMFWAFSPLYILLTGVRPVWLVLTVSSLVVVLIPVLALALMKLTNDKKLMGEYRNGWATNIILSLLVLTAIYFTWKSAVELWGKLMVMLG